MSRLIAVLALVALAACSKEEEGYFEDLRVKVTAENEEAEIMAWVHSGIYRDPAETWPVASESALFILDNTLRPGNVIRMGGKVESGTSALTFELSQGNELMRTWEISPEEAASGQFNIVYTLREN